MGKIHLRLQGLTDALMGGKFLAVVGGKGMGVRLIGPHLANRLGGHFVGLFGGQRDRRRMYPQVGGNRLLAMALFPLTLVTVQIRALDTNAGTLTAPAVLYFDQTPTCTRSTAAAEPPE